MSDLEPIEPTDPELTAHLVRRGRQSLGDDAREAILASVAGSTASVRPLGRWQWTRLAAVAAALSIVVLAVAGVATLQLGHPPTTGATILDAAGVTSAVATAQQTGATQTVLARVTIGPISSRLPLICSSSDQTNCEISLGGIVGTVPEVEVVGRPLLLDSAQQSGGEYTGVFALTIDQRYTHLLGVVQPAADGSVARTATTDAVRDAEGGTVWSAVVVTGYLHPMGVMHCPAIPATGDPLADTPFAICNGSWVADHIAPEGQSPDGLIIVQPNVSTFTPQGWDGNAPDMPEATYVLRLVANPASNCTVCRGWKVVGVLSESTDATTPPPNPTPSDPSATSSPSANPFTVDGVLTLGQFQAVVTQSRSDGVARTVVADVNLDRDALKTMRLPPCFTDLCSVGVLPGISPALLIVDAGKEVRDYLATIEPALVPGPLALRIGPASPELLGVVQINPNGTLNVKGDLLWPADKASVSSVESGSPGAVIAVHGFLVGSGSIPCPAPAPASPTAPPGGPFDNCPWAWITSQAVHVWSGSSMSAPAEAIQVQWTAYDDFVPAFYQTQTRDLGPDPFEATYLLRLVTDPRPNCSPCRGWKVVAVLDTSAASSSPPSSPPVTPTPTGALHILSQDEFIALINNGPAPAVVIADVQIPGNVSGPICDPNQPCQLGGPTNRVLYADPLSGLWGHRGASGLLAFDAQRMSVIGTFLPAPADNPDSPTWPTSPSAVSSAEAGLVGTVIVVKGWLGVPATTTCLVQPSSSPTPDLPFDPCVLGVLTATPDGPYEQAIRVQPEAYHEYSPAAGPDGSVPEAAYVLRLVHNAAPDCTLCTGWQVAGRLTPPSVPPDQPTTPSQANPTPSPTPAPASESAEILTADELRAFLQETRTKPVDVVANVAVDDSAPVCQPPGAPCPAPMGVIHDLGDAVVFRIDDPYPDLTFHDLSAPVALRIGTDNAITFLGHVDLSPQTGFAWTVPTAGPILNSTPLGGVLAVSGWLSTQAGRNGPSMPPGLPPPFNFVWADVLAPGSQDTSEVTGWASGPDFIRIQQGAYTQFAPGDHSSDGQPPQVGSYLVEHVAYHGPNCTDCDGWLMVGRLDPLTLGIDELNAALVPAQTTLPVGTIANVHGWLVDDGPPIPCPSIVAPTAPPADIWAGCYQGAWITHDQVQPVTAFGDGYTVKAPPDSVRVQPQAYTAFAPNPQFEANGNAHVPRLGTYTLQLIRDPRFPIDGALGWEVVARVDP